MSELLSELHGGHGLGAAVRWILEQQWGVISRWQLIDCGVGRRKLESWVARGLLVPIHPGVYALGHTNLQIEGRMVAALLYAGTGSGLNDATALWWFDVLRAQPTTISVCAPGRRASLPGVDVHHPRTIELTSHRRFPTVTIERALLDYAATASFGDVRMALSEADYRDLLSIERIKDVCGRGHAGSVNLTRALAEHEPRLAEARSRIERKFLALCKRYGIPLPDLNRKLGPMTVDAIWLERRVVVELDGIRGHRSPARMRRDRRRELYCRRRRFTPLRYTEDMLDKEPDLVAEDVADALGITLTTRAA